MIPTRPVSNSHPTPVILSAADARLPGLTHYSADDGYRPWLVVLVILLVIGGAAIALAGDRQPQNSTSAQQYQVSDLPSLGGTNSRGNSINNRDWIAGYSSLPTNQSRHAALWRGNSVTDLGTLGGPNSAVTWNVKNTHGTLVGISQTSIPEPLGEAWSSAAFYGGPNNVGFINLGFAWENGRMRPLPTLGGNNGFATDANSHGLAVGWAENACHDATCVPPQVLQFRPVTWDLKHRDRISELRLFAGDTSGAATAINEDGQIVGISGICDQAIGRHTAKHAVFWDNGQVCDIGNLGAPWWNTPTAINERGDVVGFAGDPAFPEGDYLHAFIWTKRDGIRPLGALPGHVHSEAYGINKRGQVVGLSCDPDFVDCRAFVWEDGVMTDLNTVKQGGYTPRLEQAKDIDKDGEITGRAINPVTGVRTAFVAEPAHGD